MKFNVSPLSPEVRTALADIAELLREHAAWPVLAGPDSFEAFEVHLAPDHGMEPGGLATAAVVTMSPEGGMTRFVYDGRMAGVSP